jgi:hypothetical protein
MQLQFEIALLMAWTPNARDILWIYEVTAP